MGVLEVYRLGIVDTMMLEREKDMKVREEIKLSILEQGSLLTSDSEYSSLSSNKI